MFPQRLDSTLAYAIAKAMMDGFNRHYRLFRTESARAKHRFETRDWLGQQRAQRERIEFYDLRVKECVMRLMKEFGADTQPMDVWEQVKLHYIGLLVNHHQPELAETFFNSVTTKILQRAHFQNDFIFVRPAVSTEFIENGETSARPTYRCYYPNAHSMQAELQRLVQDFDLRVPFEDLERDTALVLAALKTATDHLVLGGTFCTKVYRSVDYNSVMWVLQQLFEDVQTMKPNSSRSQSSEIFVICLKYTKPNFIDPKLLDPNHVFKEVADPGLKKVNVLHKKYEQSNKRQRSGYDDSLGMILRSTKTITEFFTTKEPIQMLTDVNAIEFTDSELCQKILNHARTTEEIKTCLSDLRLLGKLDFKKILKWRTQIRKELDREKNGGVDEADEEDDKDHQPVHPSLLSEDAIQEEIANLRDMASQLSPCTTRPLDVRTIRPAPATTSCVDSFRRGAAPACRRTACWW